MCTKCADIDYSIGDSIWLPCGGPASRYRGRPVSRGYSDLDGDGWAKVQELVVALNRTQAEAESLKEQARPTPAPRTDFTGTE